MGNNCKENRNGLSHSQASSKLIPNPQSLMSCKALTILFSASFLFSVGEAPEFLSGSDDRQYYEKARLPDMKLLYADLLGTSCNISEKSIATPCLSFPIGCTAIKTHNYLCKPTSAGLICSVKTSGSSDLSEGRSVLLVMHTWYLTCRYLT